MPGGASYRRKMTAPRAGGCESVRCAVVVIWSCLPTISDFFKLSDAGITGRFEGIRLLALFAKDRSGCFYVYREFLHPYFYILCVPSYKTYILNLTLKRGGRLTHLIKEKINCYLLSDYTFITIDVEVLWLRKNVNIVALVYLPQMVAFRIVLNFLIVLVFYK